MTQTQQSSAITEKVLIVKLSIGIWGARKVDKKVINDVSSQYHAKSDQLSFSKLLIDKKRLQEVKDLANNARQYHYDNTLPWNTDGSNILSIDKYEKYDSEMTFLKNKFWDHVNTFLGSYDDIIQEDQKGLGDLSNTNDYPSIDQIRKKFKFDIEYCPIPSGNDFRLTLSDNQLNNIKTNFDANMELKLNNVKSYLYSKLYALINKAIERLEDPQKFFKDSTITNITSFIDELPTVNIIEDITLNDFAYKTIKALPTDIDSLRKDSDIRSLVCSQLRDISTDMYQTGEIED